MAETGSFDLLGFGTNRNRPSSYTLSDQLTHITASINERFPCGKIVLIAHSLGGVLALAWTVENLHRVSALVLVNTPLGESRTDLQNSLLKGRFSWTTLLLKHRWLAHLACIIFRGAGLGRLFRFLKPSYVPDEVFYDYLSHNWHSLEQTFDDVVLGLPGAPLIRKIRDLSILNLMGDEDDEISRRAIQQPNVKNVSLHGGHLMLLEHPEETVPAILQFLADQPASSR